MEGQFCSYATDILNQYPNFLNIGIKIVEVRTISYTETSTKKMYLKFLSAKQRMFSCRC